MSAGFDFDCAIEGVKIGKFITRQVAISRLSINLFWSRIVKRLGSVVVEPSEPSGFPYLLVTSGLCNQCTGTHDAFNGLESSGSGPPPTIKATLVVG